MKEVYLGTVILEKRNLLGVSQEMVCNGLCSTMTLSRFEKNKQTPSWGLIEAILQRLGLPADQYHALLTREETEISLLKKEAYASFNKFEQTDGDERQQACMSTLKKLRDLERCTKGNDHINRQFILGIRAILEAHSPQQQLEMLMDAIHLTSPQFDLDNLSCCLYYEDEVAIINSIAIIQSGCGQRGRTIGIYGQLMKLVLRRTPNHKYLPLIAHNYALYLALENQCKEALEIAELGRKTCLKQGHYHLFPGFLHIEADCHFQMGNFSNSAELYQSAYYIYGAIGNTKQQNIVKNVAKERLNMWF